MQGQKLLERTRAQLFGVEGRTAVLVQWAYERAVVHAQKLFRRVLARVACWS
jgi:hypothetical protein